MPASAQLPLLLAADPARRRAPGKCASPLKTRVGVSRAGRATRARKNRAQVTNARRVDRAAPTKTASGAHNTGLVYYGRRYYDPSNGRFLGRDPKMEAGGLNLYGFCRNNGVNRWDYLGMAEQMSAFTVNGGRREITCEVDDDGNVWEVTLQDMSSDPAYGIEDMQVVGRVLITSAKNSDPNNALNYQWLRDGTSLPGTVGQSLNFFPPPSPPSPPSSLELFTILDLDLVPILGLEVAHGWVLNVGDLSQSGIWWGGGPAAGGNAGASIGIGFAPRGVEGAAGNLDANVPIPGTLGVGITLTADAHGFNGGAVTYGPGGGASVSYTNSSKYTFADLWADLSALFGPKPGG